MPRVNFRFRLLPTLQLRAKGSQETFGVLACQAPKAEPTALIKELSSKGLLKYATAPAFNARSRLLPSGKAVTKMTGVQYPFCSKCCCKSSPFSPGMCKSVIRQTVLLTARDSRNSSEDAKVRH